MQIWKGSQLVMRPAQCLLTQDFHLHTGTRLAQCYHRVCFSFDPMEFHFHLPNESTKSFKSDLQMYVIDLYILMLEHRPWSRNTIKLKPWQVLICVYTFSACLSIYCLYTTRDSYYHFGVSTQWSPEVHIPQWQQINQAVLVAQRKCGTGFNQCLQVDDDFWLCRQALVF